MARALVIGTCRVGGPTRLIRANSDAPLVRPMRHRVHTPPQILRLIDTILGRGYGPKMVHLLSTHAVDEIIGGRRDQIFAELETLRRLWASFRGFVVEVSSLREYFCHFDGERVTIDRFAAGTLAERSADIEAAIGRGEIVAIRARDVEVHRLTRGETIECMTSIKEALGGLPVVWVSHALPIDPAPRFDHIRTVRQQVVSAVGEGARRLGDAFYDPSALVEEMGQSAAFEKGGEDTTHWTAAAQQRLAEIYEALVFDLLKVRRIELQAASPGEV